MNTRRARSISVVRESILAAAVLLATIPPLFAFMVVFVAAVLRMAGGADAQAISTLSWVGIWALATATVLTLGIAITTSRIRAGRAQPHHKEYRDFKLMRHARHGPLIDPKRTMTGDSEVLSFGLRYFLTSKPVPAWWPVVSPEEAADLVVYEHPVYLCVLPLAPPAFQLWSKARRWESAHTDKIVQGTSCEVSARFADAFDLHGKPAAAALFGEEWLQRLMLSNPDWSLEVRGDRLIAYRLPDPAGTRTTPHVDPARDADDVRLVAEMAARIASASASGRTGRHEAPVADETRDEHGAPDTYAAIGPAL